MMYQFEIYITGGFKLNIKKITVLGGDQRNIALAKMLVGEGAHVTIYGFNKLDNIREITVAKNLTEAIMASNIIIGPLPFTNQHNYLNTPYDTGEISVDGIFKNMTESQMLFAGKIEDMWIELITKYNLKVYDYFKNESLQILHAIPTSEGAIQIAMERMTTTIHGSNVLVLGYGRIGKTLTKMLEGIGANVYVASKDESEITWIKSFRYRAVHLKNLITLLPKIDLIFNTIPARILSETSLKETNKEVLIIDLASPPGGVNVDITKEIGIDTVWALGLPGKVAPLSSASYIKATINQMIGELEV